MVKGRMGLFDQLLWAKWMLRREKMVQGNCYRRTGER
jgi:hypothetical protein